MFYSITGQVVYTDATSVAVSCGGVAFNCSATANTLKNIGTIGDTVTLYTYLNVREDALDMFGFYDKDELDCFKLLINVTGVGPKAALAILSQLTPNRLAVCVASGGTAASACSESEAPLRKSRARSDAASVAACTPGKARQTTSATASAHAPSVSR